MEDDFHAATPAAIAYVAAFVGWPSFFVADSPAAATPVFAAFSGGLLCFAAPSGVLRWLVDGAARASAAIFWDGAVALPCLGSARTFSHLRRSLSQAPRLN